ncbi:MAG TPA: glycosyltransferase family 39 protein, partial [Cyanophyceae cyanobacterium]
MHQGVKSFAQNSFIQQSLPLSSSRRLSWVIISFGILVRLVQYLSNRSLWNDEAALALNIVNKSYLELFKPLDYEQGAPIGFLLVEKLAVQVFGNNEYSLRLFPLLSGIAALLLFYELAKRCISRQAVPIALTLFVGLDYLLYYASEAKQYSTDVAIALLSCLLVMQV